MKASTDARSAPVRAHIGLGANLGDALHALQSALQAISALPDTVIAAVSSFYRTAPVDSSGPDYVNAVAAIDTMLTAEGLLQALQSIEAEHGRQRPYRNAPRTLDLDVLLYGDHTIETPKLTVPHPRLHERAFVLHPLAEVAPQMRVPGRGIVADLLGGVESQRVERLAP